MNHFPIRWFLIVLGISSLLLVLLGWSSWEIYKEWKYNAARAVRLQELIGVINTTDEVLTMSARMAAATGNLDWEQRYLRYEPELDKAIKEALQILPDKTLSDAISQTDEANTALVKMEKESFDLVRNHREQEAAALLFSQEYEKQKQFYSRGTHQAMEYIRKGIDSTLNRQQKRAFYSFLSVISVFLISLISWIIVLRFTSLYLDQKNASQEELQKSWRFLDSIVENLPVMVFIKDARTLRFVRFNKAGEELVGYSREELLGKNDYDFFPKEEAEFFEWKDREVLKKKFLVDIPEEPIQTRLLGQRILHTRKIPLLDRQGRPEYLLGISEDITERKKAESEIQKLEEERIRTQKMESIGTLAGGIAHDFNNLLQGIFGYISLAKLKINDPASSREMLNQAERAMHLAVNLTSQLLTFSKGGAPVKETIEVLPLIENSVKFALSGSQVNYRIHSDPDLWSINADASQISQVIQNIVLNADQAMPGGGDIRIHAGNFLSTEKDHSGELNNEKYVEISITDSGTGIPKEDLERIFDPYFTTKPKGSGLGLATSYAIVKNHDGAIDVSSQPGQGACFTIFLPASVKEAVRPGEKPRTDNSAVSCRLLVMDDDPFVLECAREFSQLLHYSITTAENGEEAVLKYDEAVKQGMPFDIVLLDLTVRGGMGGLDTLQELLKIDNKVKAVVSSGYSDDSAISSYRDQGFLAVLKKPYTFSEFQDVVNRVLNS